MIDSNIPGIVAGELLGPRSITRARSVPPGMSGASVFECTSIDGSRYALKCWPEQTKAARVREVHRIVLLARRSGCWFVPTIHMTTAGDSLVPAGQRFWELSDWVAGHALAVDAPLEQVRAGAEAIARFHQAVREAGAKLQVSPAVCSRLARKQTLDRILPATFDLDPRRLESGPLADAIAQARQLIRAQWADVGGWITRSLTRYNDICVATQYVLRDVHREHVLFDGVNLTGLIDFDALRIDTPATDLARWTASFLAGHADESAVWKAALAGYRAHSSFSLESEEMAKRLAEATVWISLANWIVWILAEKRWFAADNQRVAARVNELLLLARRWEIEKGVRNQ